jgi:hypothetical protein
MLQSTGQDVAITAPISKRDPEPFCLTLPHVAKRVDTTQWYLRYLIRNGKLKATKVYGRWLVPMSEVRRISGLPAE